MDTLCNGEPIWDTSLAWNTTNPIISRCLQRTIFIWIPSLFLFTFAPFQIFITLNKNASKKPTPIPVNFYNLSRLLVVFVIITVNAVQLVYDFIDFIKPSVLHPVTRADLLGFTLNVLTFSFFGFLIHLHRLYGVHTSAITWFFTALSVLCSLPSLYMYGRFYGVEHVYPDQLYTGISPWNRLELFIFTVHFTCLVILFILTCFADSPPQSEKNQKLKSPKAVEQPLIGNSNFNSTSAKECPDQRASFFSTMTYCWIDSLILKGFRNALTPGDLWALNEKDTSSHIAPKFATTKGAKFCTVSTIARSYGCFFLTGSAFKLAYDLMQFVGPQLLKVFINFILASASGEPLWHGYLYGAAFFLVASLESILLNYHYQIMYHAAMRVRAGLVAAVYSKSLVLSNGSRKCASLGSTINLVSVDAHRLVDTFPNINNVWSAPLQILVTLLFLWSELGPSVLAGLAVLVAMMPLNALISSYQRRYAVVAMKKKDRRLRLIGELLAGIKAVKLYGWEEPWSQAISESRSEEVKQLRRISYVKAILSFIWTCIPFVVTFFTFAVYVLIDERNVLDPSKAFVCLALFELLRIPLSSLPDVMSNVVNAMVAVARMDRFLNNEELERYVTRDEVDEKYALKIGPGSSFSWQKKAKPVLSEIGLKVRRGSLVAVVGQVASGKSSLLAACLGDMERVGDGTSVSISAGESIAYVAQQAWIRNASLRDNILFGEAYDEARYWKIIEYCALGPDLAALPAGDQTEIGEKGINLSGGQKQRVALARACYSNASLYILDDPLSAVDSHVSKHLFEKVISSATGCLKETTRLLVTNNIAILPEVDQIIVLEGGRIREAATYDELMANSGRFADFIKEHSSSSVSTSDSPPNSLSLDSSINLDLQSQVSCEEQQQLLIQNQKLSPLLKRAGKEKVGSSVEEERRLVCAEKTESGRVSVSVYINYLRSLTLPWLTMVAIGYIGMQVASVATNVWLAIWSNDGVQLDQVNAQNGTTSESSVNSTTDLRNFRLFIYGLLGLSQGLIFLFGAIAFALGTVNSSVTMHRKMLQRIMHSPSRFFDITPTGRIVNVFSKDIDAVDVAIPMNLNALVLYLLQVLATIVLICVNVPLFMLVIGPIVLLYYFIQKFYVPTSRQLKRLESVTRSPIFSHFSETLTGVSTIRAFGATQAFISELHHRVDCNLRCFYPKFLANRWLAFRLKLCGNLIVLFAAVFAVQSRDAFRDQPGFVGLIMTYSLSMTQILNWLVRQSSDLEANAVSVERIEDIASGEIEAEWRRPENVNPTVSEQWPSKGAIEFVDVSVRYRPGLELVLKKVSLVIEAGQKVGVCGRTGSGKTSLTLALFRILETEVGGQIRIDGLNIAQIGLHELRHRLAIIPQDPVLYSGTIRSNLDPFSQYTDADLWRALEMCYLKQYVLEQTSTSDQQQKQTNSGLDYPISENGVNLSVGQRQLVCLGRALLRKTKILVLDEATAAVDLETDALIQATIRREFLCSTVITIAHRLQTILDHDVVLVLDAGQIIEFDSPATLLARPTSQFYSLAKDAGIL